MTDVSDKAKIRAIGRLVHWMFSHLVVTGVIEVPEAKRWIDRMIEDLRGNDEHIQAAQYTEIIRSGIWTIIRPKPEKEVASRSSKAGKSKRGKRRKN